ncbi:MAG: aldo/keto reductase [Candidatus Omnitrophota bacterium]
MTDRRQFIQSIAALAAAAMAPPLSFAEAAEKKKDRLGDWLPTRPLGKTGEAVTMLGIGGYHFGDASEKDAQELMEAALEGGVRFFDNAVQYQNGGSEERMGKLLTPKYRDVIFLMTKSTEKTGEKALQDLENSLRRLKTEYVDLWQIHGLESPEDADERLANGVLDTALKAKESGKVRHIGFTGHMTYKAHLRMLERTKENNPFSTCQMPINVIDPSYESFSLNVLPQLTECGIGALAMKTLAFGRLITIGKEGSRVIPDRLSVEEALHFVWSLPISCLITGAVSAKEIKEKIAYARSFSAMDKEKREKLIAKVSDLAGKEREWYKA